MAYQSLEECLLDLEKTGQLRRVKEQVDPYLELATIHHRVHEAGGPALLFENIKGSSFRAASNIFGTLDRSKFIFRDTLTAVQRLIGIKNDPVSAFKKPLQHLGLIGTALNALPLRNPIRKPVLFQEISISDIPQVHHWPMDGGAFVTLPQVYTEDPENPGILNANLGMYRVQLSGNDYLQDREIGLHYQLHRGIGVHQTKANLLNKPLKVSVFIGGPPSHTVAAVMPLPEGLSEMSFAGVLGGRRFRYQYEDGHAVSLDADFVITGEVYPGENKPEGPFGDHLGYYSLQHPFPLMKVHKVYARKNAIWPFTVVGRPPQEDTSFGQLIHEMTGTAIPKEIPGVKEVHAVDAAGVHPLLLAIGSERYTPYLPATRPSELLTIANHILGTGQLSLAKFLFITADPLQRLSTHHIQEYFEYILERIHLDRDLHFHTQTTMDTLDYSGTGINSGSKVVFAAYGEVIRKLDTSLSTAFSSISDFVKCKLIMPGVVAISTGKYSDATSCAEELERINSRLSNADLNGTPLLIWTDDVDFTAASINNFLWVAFTRSNPSHDIHGINSFVDNKHWGCKGPLIIDARIKPHHAPAVELDPACLAKTDHLFAKGGSLEGILK
ncbi:MAG: UbiD family decarboxylase [Chitinophagia bacterium]